ncbi:TetR/AcrR family transcriptional regulator [Nocardia sp. CA-128927]|uniref:TetR/AcrR family transcriptional regulator n=1 Tax=Nocardia sp. CA-128927 TaxID=3239975 RepID=UPI003D9A093A
MQAAIDTLAELGYGQTSFAKIAAKAGISSTRLISYHFAGKAELTQAVVEHVLDAAATFMSPRIAAETGHWPKMAAYLASNMAFLRDHSAHVRAIVEITGNARTEDGSPVVDAAAPSATDLLEKGFRDGQRDGAYRDFDPQVMAATVRAAIDSAAVQYAASPQLDLDAYAAELTELFRRAMTKGRH